MTCRRRVLTRCALCWLVSAALFARREELQSNYFFTCGCQRCEQDDAAMAAAVAAQPDSADKVEAARKALAEGEYSAVLQLLLGESAGADVGGARPTPSSLAAAVPALVAQAFEGLALSVDGEDKESKAGASQRSDPKHV